MNLYLGHYIYPVVEPARNPSRKSCILEVVQKVVTKTSKITDFLGWDVMPEIIIIKLFH